ncbi:PREDICTED: nucleolin [Tarenaya hassleriana]|uniref:nucleolin n=1 Tax=Tarenaya hassleriana TaxID=28532 RepID=UPI00053C6862|nr:PREDICTED: nucleolin [Tarenaya hassleriana]
MPRSEDVGETQDDLMARFAALKASLPASSSSSSSSVSAIPRDGDGGGEEEEEEEEDEVEKVIKWAMDAARLDPSPESDDEDDHNHRSDDDDDEHHDGNVGTKKDGKR